MGNHRYRFVAAEVFCAMIVMGSLIGRSSPLAGRYTNILNMLLAVIVLFYVGLKGHFRIRYYFCPVLCLGLGLINFAVVHGNNFETYLFIGITYYSVALYLMAADHLNYKLWRAVFFVMSAFIMINWLRSADGYQLFYSTSRNYVVVYMMDLLFILELSAEKNGFTIPLFYYIFCFICSLSAVGRMSIACAALMLSCVIFYRSFVEKGLSRRKKLLRLFMALCFFCVVALLAFFLRDYILHHFFSRFVTDTYHSDQARSRIIISYLKKINNRKAFIFGYNARSIPYIARWNGNIHNAYLMAHAAYGLAGAAVLVCSIPYTLRRLIKRGLYPSAIILFCFFVRSMTDNTLNGQLGDVLAWYCILTFFFHGGRKLFRLLKIRR